VSCGVWPRSSGCGSRTSARGLGLGTRTSTASKTSRGAAASAAPARNQQGPHEAQSLYRRNGFREVPAFNDEHTRITGSKRRYSRVNMSGTVLDAIGNTPIAELRKVGRLAARASWRAGVGQSDGSMKDRMARAAIEAAERDGRLLPGGTVVEATMGTTGNFAGPGLRCQRVWASHRVLRCLQRRETADHASLRCDGRDVQATLGASPKRSSRPCLRGRTSSPRSDLLVVRSAEQP